jgi:hypothetical protein
MATKIVTKNSSTGGAVPSASDLVQGELAVNVADKRLFTEDNGGSIVELGTNPSTIDIDGGTIDGTTIGASSASTGAFTTLTATGLTVDTDTLYVDSTNNRVGIGTTSPAGELEINSSGDSDVYIRSGDGNAASLYFGSQSDSQEGAIRYYNSNNSLRFFGYNMAEAMRIDSSGNLLVGTTDSTLYNQSTNSGFAYQTGQALTIARSGGDPLALNRLSTDGSMLLFQKDGTTVGSIGTINNEIYIQSGDVGLQFDASGNDIVPYGGGFQDATIDLGSSANRFKDLHLSGGVYAGAYASFVQGGGGDLFITNDRASADLSITSGRTLIFGANGSESMRITSAGRLCVNMTDNLFYNSGGLHVTGFASKHCAEFKTQNIGLGLLFVNPSNSAVGSIIIGSSSTAFNTSSDQRLKENIADADDAGSKIDAIQVRKYDWKADGSHQDYGMIAQELVEVAPEAVTVPADSEEMMGVDYSKLVPMLIKEIQSLRNRVAQLEE